MEQYEQWDAHLERAFAGASLEYADHPHEIEVAQKALIAAINSNISFEAFVEGVQSAQERIFTEKTVVESEQKRLRDSLKKRVALVETYFAT